MAKFTLKIQSHGLVTKYRFDNLNSLPNLLANHIRQGKPIDSAWLKCTCHNIDVRLEVAGEAFNTLPSVPSQRQLNEESFQFYKKLDKEPKPIEEAKQLVLPLGLS